MANSAPALAPGEAAFAFAGSGLMFPYYFGVLTVLLRAGYIAPGVTPLAGISGGALTAAVGCSGAAPQAALFHLLSALERHPADFWAAREGIIRALGDLTSPGSHGNCTGRLHVALSYLDEDSYDSLYGSKPVMVSEFRSDEDMWAAVVGSSTVACAGYDPAESSYGGPPYFMYRGEPVADGAYAADLGTLCGALGLPYGVPGTRCVSISSFEPGPFRLGGEEEEEEEEQRDEGEDWCDAGPAEETCSAIQTAPTASAASARPRAGPLPRDCSAFFPSGGRGPSRRLPEFLPAFDPRGGSSSSSRSKDGSRTHSVRSNTSNSSNASTGSSDSNSSSSIGAGWPSICPGCDARNPLPFTRKDWQRMALDGGAAFPHLRRMAHIGARDAELWVGDQRGRRREPERERERGEGCVLWEAARDGEQAGSSCRGDRSGVGQEGGGEGGAVPGAESVARAV